MKPLRPSPPRVPHAQLRYNPPVMALKPQIAPSSRKENPMPQPLASKVALVAGASRGIGAAIAERLARDGASVAFTYASAKQKADELARVIESAGGRALAIHADSA